jgi:hypothetical protein
MSSSMFSPVEKAVLAKVGSMKQVASIRRAVLDDGRERGVRVAEFRNGGGMAFTVLLDRGMDIADASFGGVSLSFLGPGPLSHPAYYKQHGPDWLRSWGGGMLVGCGLRNVGAPSELDGERLGLHGRLSNTPAENVNCYEGWADSRYLLSVSGTMREARLFGENLVLTRTVATEFGVNVISVSDTVRNVGFEAAHVMLLYHMNFGWPLLDESTVVESVPHKVAPRNETAAAGLDAWDKFQEPVEGFEEQCFYHEIPSDERGMASMALHNKKLGLKATVSYRAAELPLLTQWKCPRAGIYVMGLEPGNCHVEGAEAEREKFKSLRVLQPGESFETLVRLSVERV